MERTENWTLPTLPTLLDVENEHATRRYRSARGAMEGRKVVARGGRFCTLPGRYRTLLDIGVATFDKVSERF